MGVARGGYGARISSKLYGGLVYDARWSYLLLMEWIWSLADCKIPRVISLFDCELIRS